MFSLVGKQLFCYDHKKTIFSDLQVWDWNFILNLEFKNVLQLNIYLKFQNK